MTTYVPPKKNTAWIGYVGLLDAAGGGRLKGTPTLAAGDFKVSIDGGALANLATLPTNTPASSKMLKVSLSAGEMNGDNITVVCADQTSPPEWCDTILSIQTSAQQIDDLLPTASYTAPDNATILAIAGYVDTEVAAIKAKTDNLPAIPAAVGSAMTLTSGERDSVADATLDRANAVEIGLTLRQWLRGAGAVLLGKLTGGGTTTNTFRSAVADSKDRVTATVDASGNRSAITIDTT